MQGPCGRCGRFVGAAEERLALDRSYHLECFTCAICNKGLDSLTLEEFSELNEIYCKTCFRLYVGPHGYGYGPNGPTLIAVPFDYECDPNDPTGGLKEWIAPPTRLGKEFYKTKECIPHYASPQGSGTYVQYKDSGNIGNFDNFGNIGLSSSPKSSKEKVNPFNKSPTRVRSQTSPQEIGILPPIPPPLPPFSYFGQKQPPGPRPGSGYLTNILKKSGSGNNLSNSPSLSGSGSGTPSPGNLSRSPSATSLTRVQGTGSYNRSNPDVSKLQFKNIPSPMSPIFLGKPPRPPSYPPPPPPLPEYPVTRSPGTNVPQKHKHLPKALPILPGDPNCPPGFYCGQECTQSWPRYPPRPPESRRIPLGPSFGSLGTIPIGIGELCRRCGRPVYQAEMQLGYHGAYHTECFKCCICGKKLDSTTVSEHQGEIFCKGCYKKNFATAGVGFGIGAGTLQTP